jgi:hypothetical protein
MHGEGKNRFLIHDLDIEKFIKKFSNKNKVFKIKVLQK